MKKKYSYMLGVILLSAIALIFSMLTLFFSVPLALIELGIFVFFGAIVIYKTYDSSKELRKFLDFVGVTLDSMGNDGIDRFPIPVCILDGKLQLSWYNRAFTDSVLQGDEFLGEKALAFMGISEGDINDGHFEAHIKNRVFTVFVYSKTTPELGSKFYSLYFLDSTEFYNLRQEYIASRPVVGIITIDNFDEMQQGAKESEKAQLAARIEGCLEEYFSTTTGFVRKFERDRFIVLIEDRHLQKLIDDHFTILDKIKALSSDVQNSTATISIGFGRDADSYYDALRDARLAIDKSLGRGGDQVTIKTDTEYVSYGGKTEGVGKRTQVLARMMASDILKLVERSSNVIIVGHRFSDFDCVAAAAGLYTAFSSINIETKICIDESTTLSGAMLESLKQGGLSDAFVTPSRAELLLIPETLVIIVDTNNPELLESKSICDEAHTKVLIDHHRMVQSHITGARVFYHEPYASSTCELVSEMIQYIGEDVKIPECVATAMLSGIMLDTKDFVLQTGSRTFEAAAYLRRIGANTVVAKKMFANSKDRFELISQIVLSATIYRGCAVAVTSKIELDADIPPQAADELLYIKGVEASFVISDTKSGTRICARSMGTINVQYILESIGHGGGHFTAAAIVLPDTTVEEAQTMLGEAIDKYYAK